MEAEFEDCSMTYLQPKAREIVEHFEKPIPKEAQTSPDIVVDEAYALQYADLKADEKEMKKLLVTMNETLKAKRMPGEKHLQMGKALVIYTDVDDEKGVDYKALWEGECGPVDAKLAKKYTKVTRKGYTTCEVKVL